MRYSSIAGLILLLLIAVSPSSSALQYTVPVGLLAIDSSSGRGVVVPAVVHVKTGTGIVVLKPLDKVDNSVLYSVMVAHTISALFSHRDPRTVDITIDFKVSSSIGGPSAGGFIAGTILALLEGFALDTRNTTMTGMVSVTGLVLPVAGIPNKVRAAAEKGYKRVLLPQPWLEDMNYTSTRATIVEGVTVEPVCSIVDTMYRLTGIEDGSFFGLKSSANYTVIPSSVLEVFKAEAEKLISYSSKLLDYVNDSRVKSTTSLSIDYANKALARGDYYAAASLAFSGLLTVAKHLEEIGRFNYVEEVLNTSLDKALERAAQKISSVKLEAGNNLCYYWRFVALAEAAHRLHLAKRVLGHTDAGQNDRALALLRAVTAEVWANTAAHVEGPIVYCSHLYNLTLFLSDYAELAYNYLVNIVDQRLLVTVDKSTLSSWVSDMKKAVESGDYVLGMGLAIFTLSYIESVLASTSSTECITVHYGYLREYSGPYGVFPGDLYFSYAVNYSSELANLTGSSEHGREQYMLSLGAEALVRAFLALAVQAVEDYQPTVLQAGEASRVGVNVNRITLFYFIILAEAVIVALLVTATARLGSRHEAKECQLPTSRP